MLFKPKWVKLLPPHLRPDGKLLSELEKLRVKVDAPHEALAMRIAISPASTRKVLRQCLANFKLQNPKAAEKELLKMVLISRIQTPTSFWISEKEIDQAMKNISSFDNLCDYVIALEAPSPFDSFGEQTEKILAQEEAKKEMSAENAIKLLEQIYFDLKKEHPGQGEPAYFRRSHQIRTICCHDNFLELDIDGIDVCGIITYRSASDIDIEITKPYQGISNGRHIPYFARQTNSFLTEYGDKRAPDLLVETYDICSYIDDNFILLRRSILTLCKITAVRNGFILDNDFNDKEKRLKMEFKGRRIDQKEYQKELKELREGIQKDIWDDFFDRNFPMTVPYFDTRTEVIEYLHREWNRCLCKPARES